MSNDHSSANITESIAANPVSIPESRVAAEERVQAIGANFHDAETNENVDTKMEEEMPPLLAPNVEDQLKFRIPDSLIRTSLKEQFEKLWDKYFFALKEIVTAHTMQQLAEQVQPAQDEKKEAALDDIASPRPEAQDKTEPMPISTEKEKAEASFAQLTASTSPPTLANLRAHDSRLARWVQEQKRNAQKWEAGMPSTMSEDRMHQLNSINFFSLFPDKYESSWNDNFDRLKAHYVETGNYDVTDDDLKRWTKKQKVEYDAFESAAEHLGVAVTDFASVEGEDNGKDAATAEVGATEVLPQDGIAVTGIDTEMTDSMIDTAVADAAVTEAIVADAISAAAALPSDIVDTIASPEETTCVAASSDDHKEKGISTLTTVKTSITRERVDKLDTINFAAYIPSTNSLPKFQVRLKEVVAFQEKHGHTKIPKVFPANKPLGRWVSRIRNQYRLYTAQKPCCLTDEMVEQLNVIDFEWVSTSKFSANVTWSTRFEELNAYKTRFSHTNVPKKYKNNLLLGTWVRNQRYQYMANKRGKKSPITDDRIKLLDGIGFQWTPNKNQGDALLPAIVEVRNEEKCIKEFSC